VQTVGRDELALELAGAFEALRQPVDPRCRSGIWHNREKQPIGHEIIANKAAYDAVDNAKYD